MKMCGGVEVMLHAFLTSALDRSEISPSCSGCVVPGKSLPVRTGQEAGWAPEPVWTVVANIKSPTGNRTPVVQPVAREALDTFSYVPDWLLVAEPWLKCWLAAVRQVTIRNSPPDLASYWARWIHSRRHTIFFTFVLILSCCIHLDLFVFFESLIRMYKHFPHACYILRPTHSPWIYISASLGGYRTTIIKTVSTTIKYIH
jgi:hypothetical protein